MRPTGNSVMKGTHISAMHLEGMDENVVLMDTISKRYSACGGRIGAFITRNKTVLDTVMKFAQARLSPPSFAQILGEAAVDLPEIILIPPRRRISKTTGPAGKQTQ